MKKIEIGQFWLDEENRLMEIHTIDNAPDKSEHPVVAKGYESQVDSYYDIDGKNILKQFAAFKNETDLVRLVTKEDNPEYFL